MYVLELAGEDDAFAAAEAENAAEGVEPLAPGLALARTVDASRLVGLAYTRASSELVGRSDASVSAARALLEASALDRSGTVAVRARDVRGTAGIDTQAAERALGDVLTAEGLAVDLEAPEHELRALFAGETCVLGWLVAESRRDFGDRAPTDKPFFQPGSMEPLEARAVCNLARAGPASTVLDPLCGTGGLLVEAGLLGARVVGLDAQARMVQGARENLRHYLDGGWAVIQGDATRLPVGGPVEAVVADVPYGRQSAIAGRDADAVVAGVLAEARRVADRAVVVADRDRSADARAAGWTVAAVYERPVHRSLTRFVHVLGG
ncbi:MAG: methyltransferase domain-containing protein [Halobacteriales archaeon]